MDAIPLQNFSDLGSIILDLAIVKPVDFVWPQSHRFRQDLCLPTS